MTEKPSATPGAILAGEPSIPSEGSRPRELHQHCIHNKGHVAEVCIAYLKDTGRYMAEVKIRCADCGQPFRFMGLPLGLNLNGATLSVDGLEALLAIMPADRIPHPLQGVTGFGVKAS